VAEGNFLEFKWETYNVTNHINLANPNGTVEIERRRPDHIPCHHAPNAVRLALPLLKSL